MKKILLLLACLIFSYNFSAATEKVEIDKQLVGIVGAVTGEVKTNTRVRG